MDIKYKIIIKIVPLKPEPKESKLEELAELTKKLENCPPPHEPKFPYGAYTGPEDGIPKDIREPILRA